MMFDSLADNFTRKQRLLPFDLFNLVLKHKFPEPIPAGYPARISTMAIASLFLNKILHNGTDFLTHERLSVICEAG